MTDHVIVAMGYYWIIVKKQHVVVGSYCLLFELKVKVFRGDGVGEEHRTIFYLTVLIFFTRLSNIAVESYLVKLNMTNLFIFHL